MQKQRTAAPEDQALKALSTRRISPIDYVILAVERTRGACSASQTAELVGRSLSSIWRARRRLRDAGLLSI